MFFIATLLLVLLSACALAAPPMVPPRGQLEGDYPSDERGG